MAECMHSTFANPSAVCRRPLGPALVLAVGCAALALQALALDPGVQFHGFLSQGFSYTSDNNFFGGSTEEGSFDYTEVGINGSVRAGNDLLMTGQLLYRRAGNADDQVALDYGLLDYRAYTTEHADLGVRLGRIKNPLGLYNDTRDVAVSRPSIILPQSIYFDRTRDLALSGDGIGLYGERRLAKGFLSAEFNVVKPRVDTDTLEPILLGAQRPGAFEDEPSALARVIFDTLEQRLRIALSVAALNLQYRPGEGDVSSAGDVLFSPRILSVQYDAENWIVTAEYARREFQFNDIAYIPFTDRTGESYYFQAQYKVGSCCWLLARRDVLYQNVDDKSGTGFEASTGGVRPAHTQFAKDWTVGLRWSPEGRNWLVSAEHHWVHGTAWLPIEDNPDPAQTVEDWRMALLLVSVWF